LSGTDFPPDADQDVLDLPSMDTETGMDAALEYLLENDLPCECSVIQEDDNMALRVRYPDGSEELFALKVLRSVEIAASESERN
jgi:hypothetical protein